MKGIIKKLLSAGSSIVKFRLRYRPFNVVRKSAAATVLGILARVSSTYLLYREGNIPLHVSFSLKWHINTLAISGPRGEPIATPSVCSYK